jgi:hypothetical protein
VDDQAPDDGMSVLAVSYLLAVVFAGLFIVGLVYLSST